MAKKEEKLTLPFVNKGKPFKVNNWTVEKHEKALELMISEQGKDLSEKEEETLFRFYAIYVSLKEIDDEVSFHDVRNMHPENLLKLFNIVYLAGRVEIFFRGKDQGEKHKD